MTHRRRCYCCEECTYFTDAFTRALTESGDTGNVLSGWSVDFDSYANDLRAVYWGYVAPGSFPGTGTVSLYAESGHSTLLAQGTGTIPAATVTLNLTAQNGSGLSGSVAVGYEAANDTGTLHWDGATYTETGDVANKLASWSLAGMSEANSDNYTWYWSLSAPVSYPGSGTLNLYKDSGKTQLVASGTATIPKGDVTITLFASGGSGITGSVTVACEAATDNDASNTLTWKLGANWSITSGDWYIGWDGPGGVGLMTADSDVQIVCASVQPGDAKSIVLEVDITFGEWDDRAMVVLDVDGLPKRVVIAQNSDSVTVSVWIYEDGVEIGSSTLLSSAETVPVKICLTGPLLTVNIGTGTMTAYTVEVTEPTSTTIALGTETSFSGEPIRFNNLTLSKHADDYPSCPDCTYSYPYECQYCGDAGAPGYLMVTVSGIANLGCNECANANGTYVLVYQATEYTCLWAYYGSSICGGTGLGFSISSAFMTYDEEANETSITVNFVEHDVSGDITVAQFAGTFAGNCLQVSCALTLLNSNPTRCDVSGATVTVRAL